MLSLIKFLGVLALFGALAFGGVYALAHFVEPKQRDMSFSISIDKIEKKDVR